MVLVNDVLLEIAAQLLQSEDHVVDFHAVYKLRIVPQLCLYAVELGIELLEVRELCQM